MKKPLNAINEKDISLPSNDEYDLHTTSNLHCKNLFKRIWILLRNKFGRC